MNSHAALTAGKHTAEEKGIQVFSGHTSTVRMEGDAQEIGTSHANQNSVRGGRSNSVSFFACRAAAFYSACPEAVPTKLSLVF